MISNMDELFLALGRASLMLALSAAVVQCAIKLLHISSSRARRLGWFCVLVQGLILIRLPLTIPWTETDATPPSTIVSKQTADLEKDVYRPILELESASIVSQELRHTNSNPLSSHALNTPKHFSSWLQFAAYVWLVGVTILIGTWLASYLYFLRRLSLKPAIAAWESEWQQMLADHGISHGIKLCLTHDLGPALCFLPSGYHVLIPEIAWRNLAVEERRAVLRHELAHYQRGDLWKSVAVRLLVFAHWFNVVAWWVGRQYQNCGEWLCDDRVTQEFNPAVYSRALLKLSGTNLRPVAHGHGGRSGHLFQRIQRVLAPEKDTVVRRSVLSIVTLPLLCCGLFRLELVAQQIQQSEAVVSLIGTGVSEPSSSALRSGGRLPPGARLLLGTSRFRQPTSAYRALYSPDGKTVAVSGNGTYDSGSSVCLWDAHTGLLQVEIPVPVISLAYSPRGHLLAGGDSQGRIHIWDTLTGRTIKEMRVKFTVPGELLDPRVHELAFLNDTTLLTAHRRGSTGIIRRWDIPSGEELPRQQKLHDGLGKWPIMTLSPDRKFLALGIGRSIRVWNLESNDRPVSIELEQILEVESVEFAENSRLLVVCGRHIHRIMSLINGSPDSRSNVQIWDLSTLQQRQLPSDKCATETAVDIAVDQRQNRLIVVSDQSIQVWDLSGIKVLAHFLHARQRTIALHPDGRQLALTGAGSRVELLNLESGIPMIEDPPSHDDKITVVAYSPNGQRVVTAGNDDKIHIWEAESGQHLQESSEPFYRIHSIAFSPDGRNAAVLGNRPESIEEKRGNHVETTNYIVGAVILIDVETAEVGKRFRVPSAGSCVAYSKDSRMLAVTSIQQGFLPMGNKSGIISLFDVTSGVKVQTFGPEKYAITAVALSPQGERLWSITKDANVREWDTKSGQVIQEFMLKTERAEAASISISLTTGATIPGWPGAQVWDLKMGQLICEIEAPLATNGTTVVAISPNGERLAMGTESRSLSVHDIASRQIVFEASRLSSRPRSLAFSSDGKYLISGMEDSTAIIFDLPLKP